jgi:hypothetical protein
MPSLHVGQHGVRQESMTKLILLGRPDFQHYHWEHHDAALESSARDGVPWQEWPLDRGKQQGRRASVGALDFLEPLI